MQKEYNSIMKNNTWTLVLRPKDAKVVKSRWVLLTKDNGLHKARFCAKGFTQRWGEDYDETFAPVAKYASIRTLFALLAGRKKAKVHQMDVNTAFLYSIHENENGEHIYIALYVDDLIIAGDDEDDIHTIKQRLSEQFEMKDLGIAKKFLGIEIEYGNDGSVKLHQNQYIQRLIDRHGMGESNPVATPLDTSVKLTSITAEEAPADPQEYARIVGGLTFAACVTRPDIACTVGQLSQFLNNPSSTHMQAAKRVLRYLQGTANLGITYRPPPLKLQGYSDANWAGDMDTRRSTTGYVVMLG